jgi:PKD repeat protein
MKKARTYRLTFNLLIFIIVCLFSFNISSLYGQEIRQNLQKALASSKSATSKALITARFSHTPLIIITGLPVKFLDKSTVNNQTGIADARLWDFGDGNASYEQNPSHTYQNPGTYTISLTVTAGSASSKATKKVKVYGSKATSSLKIVEVLPDFTFSPVNPEVGMSVQFKDASTGNPTSWSWDFGDGGKSTNQNPQHQYQNSGTFNVTLTVSNGTSSKSLIKTITVIPGLTPGFSYSPANPEAGELIQFQDSTSGNPSAWSWNFGDGSTSNLQNPSHLYNNAGTYTVTLQVTNGDYTKTVSKTIIVLAPITVGFSYSPANPVVGQDVQFSNTSTGSITSYSWNFGDGSTSTLKDPVHKYSAAGNFTVTLTATNAKGSKSKSQTITVNQSLSPSFSYSPASPYAGQTVQFTDNSSGNPTSRSWDFGDGSVSSLQNPTHAYSSAGTYTVTLTASNSLETKTASKTINVKAVIQADFTYSPSNPTAGAQIQFTDKSTGSITSWSWQFGDGGTSNQKNPTKTYSTAGSYNVKLTVSDGTTSNSMTQTVTVVASLAADFTLSPNSPAVGQEVQFLDNSQGSPTSWSWDFGDGGKTTAKNPTHTYSQAGAYSVKLVISDGTNSSTKSKSLTVSSTSSSKVITASSCTLADVQAAIATAKPGDTVVVPAGETTWSAKLVITTGIILKGAGIDRTIIHNGYSNASDYDEALIMYRPSDFDANWPFRITGFTFDLNNRGHGILLAHHRSSSLVIQTKIRIDHNKFTGSPDSLAHQAIINNGMRGCVDNNVFDGVRYPIRHQSCYHNGKEWWDNWEGIVYGKEDNNVYYEDNVFKGVEVVSDCQYANRYAFRYNTIYPIGNPYPLFDAHGNQGTGYMYSSFGVEIYGNLIITPQSYFNFRFLDHRGGKALVFMNVVTAASGDFNIRVRDEYPDSLNPTINSSPQFPNDSYYFLNRRNYTGSYNDVTEGQHSDNPPYYECPMIDRDYFIGRDNFDGTSGIGYGLISTRLSNPTKVGVAYWETGQDVSDLRGMVGVNPTTPISGTLYKCTAPGVWSAYFKPYTYPHPLRSLLND